MSDQDATFVSDTRLHPIQNVFHEVKPTPAYDWMRREVIGLPSESPSQISLNKSKCHSTLTLATPIVDEDDILYLVC